METSAKINVCNEGKGECIVYIEPWAEDFVLNPNETKVIKATGETDTPWFHVIHSERGLQIYVEKATTYSVEDAS